MKRLNLSREKLRLLYPPVSPAFEKTVRQTLQNFQNEKEQPVMKKKISLGLAVALVLILLTISAAIALTQSDLLDRLFGGDQSVPEAAQEMIRQPDTSVAAQDVTVTLNEYLYDGETLHLHWTVSSNTDRQVMITMSPFFAGGRELLENGPAVQTPQHDCGQLLGGEVEGIALPASASYFATCPGYLGEEEPIPFTPGETLSLSFTVYVWEPQSTPILVDAAAMWDNEDFVKVFNQHRLPADRTGFCELAKFVMDESLMTDYSGEDYRRVYGQLGWAKVAAQRDITFQVALDGPAGQLRPVLTVYETESFTLEIEKFAYAQTGGSIELRVYPKPLGTKLNMDPLHGATSALCRPLGVLDADSKGPLDNGHSYGLDEDDRGNQYVHYQIDLAPVAGEMPSALLIVPKEYVPEWDKEADVYDPHAAQNPVNGTPYRYKMVDAVRAELK